MLLDNYKAIVKSSALYASNSYDTMYVSGIKCIPMSGDTSKNYFVGVNCYINSLASNGSTSSGGCTSSSKSIINSDDAWSSYGSDQVMYIWLIVGDGADDVQPSDYKLSGDILKLSLIACENIQTDEEDSVKRRLVFTTRNDTGETMQINEYGWVAGCATTNGNGSFKPSSTTANKVYPVLFERTKLDSPITLAPGETASFELVFETYVPVLE